MNQTTDKGQGEAGGRWSIPQLLRFEQYRQLDSDQDEELLATRDRSVWQQFSSHNPDDKGRSSLYRFWLSQRQQQPIQPDGGEIFTHSFTVVSQLLMLLGLLSGIGITASALYYDGTVPVNVALFLGVVVAPQLLLLALLMVSLLLAFSGSPLFTAWYQPAASFSQWLLAKVWKRYARITGGGVGEAADDATINGQILRQTLKLHRPLFTNRALRLMQSMGIAFNIGVVGCMWVLLAVTDRAFGWQSSLTGSAETVQAVISTLALPWSAFIESGLPTLEQIQTTHILLGSGAAESLQQQDFKAWWPFMMLCVLVYGLLPRLLIWLFAAIRERNLLENLDFADYHYQALWRRMQSVDLHSYGKPSEHSAEADEAHTPVETIRQIASQPSLNVYLQRDTLSRYAEEYLKTWLPLSDEHQANIQTIDQLAEIQPTSGLPAYLIVEGWQPPIEETLHGLAEVAERLAGQGSDLHLLLLGKPGAAGSKPVTSRLAEVWRKKLDLLQQSNLIIHADSAPHPSITPESVKGAGG